jgi:hypothetical protein
MESDLVNPVAKLLASLCEFLSILDSLALLDEAVNDGVQLLN